MATEKDVTTQTYSLAQEKEDTTSDLRQLILTNELGNRMLDMVAPIYDKSKAALYLFQALGIVLQKEIDFVSGDFINQMFPQTATWGLEYWEDEYGVVTDVSKSLEQRRAYLMSVMYKKRPMTPKRLEQIIKGVTGFDSEILENVADNTFQVIIRGYVANLKPVIDELDKKAPAHLNYLLRMSELVETSTTTYTGFAVSECERFELETLNNADKVKEIGKTTTYTGFAVSEYEQFEVEVQQ